jgi:hypothetical protein
MPRYDSDFVQAMQSVKMEKDGSAFIRGVEMRDSRYVGGVTGFIFVLIGSPAWLVAGRTCADMNEFCFGCEKVIV